MIMLVGGNPECLLVNSFHQSKRRVHSQRSKGTIRHTIIRE
eukprot:UN16813